MNSHYTSLFSIALQHEYFQDRSCTDFEISPAADCLPLLKRMNIQWRYFENRYYAFTEANNRQEPFLNNADGKYFRKDYGNSVLRFYLRLKAPLFLNYTNLDPGYSNRKKFYFSNTAKNSGNGTLNLSAPVPAYANDKQYLPGNLAQDSRTGKVFEALKKYTSKKKADLSDLTLWAPKGLTSPGHQIAAHKAGKAYLPGDLVMADSGDLFEAVIRHTGGDNADLTNPSLWTARQQGQLQYASEADLIGVSAGKFTYIFPEPVKKADITILGFNYNPAAPAYDVTARETETKTFSQPESEVSVSLTSLKPGKYLIKVNKETIPVYYDPAVELATSFGVIEIYNHLSGEDEYSFLTTDEQINSKSYQILFPARRVLWKYIRKDGKADAITDTGDTGFAFNLRGDEFISSAPMPLSESPVKTLRLDFNTADFRLFPLPNPSMERLKRCTQDDYDYFCSEVNLNY